MPGGGLSVGNEIIQGKPIWCIQNREGCSGQTEHPSLLKAILFFPDRFRPNRGDWSGQGNGAFSSSGRAVGGRALW